MQTDSDSCIISKMGIQELEARSIRSCQEGSHESFSVLFDMYAEKIYNFLFYRTFQKELSEDLSSETFAKAFQNIRSFSPEKGTFSSWIYRIAKNTLIDHYRTDKQTVDIDSVFDLGLDEKNEERLDAKKNLEEIRGFLKTLSKEQQDIITLRVWDELSYKEIAEILGKSEGSCKVMFSRVVAKIREEFPEALLLAVLLRMYI